MDRLEEIKARSEAAAQPYPVIRKEIDVLPYTQAQLQLQNHAKKDIPYLLAEVARLTAERDAALRRAEAAVKDLFQMQKAIPILSRRCKFCTERSCRDETGLLMVDGGNCRNGDMWEWRDVCAENTEGGPADEA